MSTDAREAAPSPPPGSRRRRGALVALVLAAVLAVGGVLLVVTGLEQPSAPPAPAPAPRSAIEPVAPPTSAAPARAASPPTAITIPSIGVDSPVNSVGLNPDRTLEVPAPGPLYDQAAWFRGSPAPGVVGPSVILGHVDSARNGPSVFYRLGALRPGSAFTVARADGSVLSFRVDGVRSYPKDAFPTETVYGPTVRPEMRLITCGGDFDSSARSYVDNTVVFAHLIA